MGNVTTYFMKGCASKRRSSSKKKDSITAIFLPSRRLQFALPSCTMLLARLMQNQREFVPRNCPRIMRDVIRDWLKLIYLSNQAAQTLQSKFLFRKPIERERRIISGCNSSKIDLSRFHFQIVRPCRELSTKSNCTMLLLLKFPRFKRLNVWHLG